MLPCSVLCRWIRMATWSVFDLYRRRSWYWLFPVEVTTAAPYSRDLREREATAWDESSEATRLRRRSR